MFRRLGIVSDHAGIAYKTLLINKLKDFAINLTDFGPSSTTPIDYPDAIAPMCRQITQGIIDGGIAICGSGHGVCITSNKFSGIRAINPTTTESCRVGRQHNDATVLCLGARFIDEITAECFISNTSNYWATRLESQRVPFAIVNDYKDALEDAQVQHRQLIKTISHPTSGKIRVVGPPWKMSGTQADITSPPLLGEHTMEVLKQWLNWNDDQIQDFKNKKS